MTRVWAQLALGTGTVLGVLLVCFLPGIADQGDAGLRVVYDQEAAQSTHTDAPHSFTAAKRYVAYVSI